MANIKISRDFTNKPGGRYIHEGPKSGEEFRETILLPAYDEAINKNGQLVVDLNDCYGLAPSFLEESFGGVVRKVKNKKILEVLVLKTEDRPGLEEKIINYIKEA
jgi:hypothetical protein